MKNYNPNKESSYLTYLDANNLYEWATNQYLPNINFELETKNRCCEYYFEK